MTRQNECCQPAGRCTAVVRALLFATLFLIAGGSTLLVAQPKKKQVKPAPANPQTGVQADAPGVSSATLLEVGREKFSVAQIADAYKSKANRGGKTFSQLSRDSALDFINLYANFRLKVQAALDEGIDKRPEVIADLRTNRMQLAVPPAPNVGYLLERKLVDPAIQRIFKRRDEELLLSVIYVAMRPNDPADTLRAYNRALTILQRVKNGADFAEMAHDSSDDPATKDAGGRLPSYITGGLILPVLEDAAYETRAGTIYPGLVRVPAGFVVLKVLDRSPRVKIHGAHILVMTPASDTDPNSDAHKKAEAALKRIRAGEDFATVAREMSDDKTSGANGGDFMSYYTRSLGFEARNAKLEPEIESALYHLKDGEVSDLVRTQKFGYHILKRLDSRKITFDEEKDALRQIYKQRLMGDDRTVFVHGVVDRHGLKINPATFDQVLAAVNQNATTADTAWAAGIGNGLRGETMFEYGGVKYSVGAWIDSMRARPDLRAAALSRKGVRDAIYTLFEQTAMIDEAKNLEQEYPEFASLMQEFRDGILIFNLEDEMIWKKMNQGYTEEKGRAFYEAHKGKYLTQPKYALTEIFLYKDDDVKPAYQKALAGSVPFDTLATQLTERAGYRERNGHWGLNTAKNSDIVAQVLKLKPSLKAGDILEPFSYQGGWSIVRVDSIEAPRQMTFDEAKTEVQGDFVDDLQTQLTHDWVSQLRAKYHVRIDEKVLSAAVAGN
ncbi:MAG: peptidylprolyl isomerase [Bacteroidetes bacterium]|nr:peptidylprolyl isomerase [Bacteroidota bacterium]